MTISSNNMSPESILVGLDKIGTDEKAQTRTKVNAAVVQQYAAAMAEQVAEGGSRFPPVVLFTDGTDFWLGDGFHRVLAARKAGLSEISAEVRPGTQRDALLFGIGANSTHGLPRNTADKRRAVQLLLADPEWSQWSDREIARRCQVHPHTVKRIRSASDQMIGCARAKCQRGDTIYEMPRHAKNGPGGTTPTATAVLPTDRLGIPLPEGKVEVFAAAAHFQEAQELFERLATLLDRIAQRPGGDVYRQELIQSNNHGKTAYVCAALRAARAKLVAAEPHCAYCPSCHFQRPTRGYASCKVCGGRGWTSRATFESCRDRDRQEILKMASAKPK